MLMAWRPGSREASAGEVDDRVGLVAVSGME
jgi:hypothetical protein